MQNLVYEWFDFFPDFPKFESKMAQIQENFGKSDNFTQNLADGYDEWVTFFLKNWYLYGSTFKFCGSMCVATKTKLEFRLRDAPLPCIINNGQFFFSSK